MTRRQVDRLAGVHAPGDVADNAVAQLGRVEQAHCEQRGAVLQCGVLGESLSPEPGLGVLPDRPHRVGFPGAAACRRAERVHVAAAHVDDAGAAVAGDETARQLGVDRPGRRGIPRGAELVTGQEQHLPGVRQRPQGPLLHQVGGDRPDSCALEVFPQTRLGKA